MGKVIVCGLGQVGYRVTSLLLRMGESVTVIAIDTLSEFEREIRELGATVIIGDARDKAYLMQAEVDKANSLIACTDSDLTNIEIALDSRTLNPTLRVVARLFDQTLARRLESSVGIHRALAMSLLAAPSFAAAAIGSNVIGSFDHQGQNYSVRLDDSNWAEVNPSEPVVRSLKKSRVKLDWSALMKNTPKLLIGVFAAICILAMISVLVFSWAMNLSIIDSLYYVITTLTTTGYGDITVKDHSNWIKLYACFLMVLGSAGVATLYSIITDYLVSTRFDEILGRQQVSETDHVIVIGIGNVGYRVCEALVKMGHPVVAIDSDSNAKYRSLLPKEVTFVSGDGRDEETLKRAGIDDATSVISATHNDAINLSTCLVAKGLNSKIRAVVRLFDGGFARKVEQALDVDSALSASRISSPGFVGAAVFPEAVFSFATEDEFVTIIPKDGAFEFARIKLKPLQAQS